MLLFWPCSWGLTYAYSSNQNLNLYLYYLVLFFLGSVLMRSAGCIFNDIVDKDFDKKVKRTKTRPIAAGKISLIQCSIYILVLCSLALLILLQFNLFTIVLGMSSMILAFSYPFMKRLTYWPQLFLGITFNWGIVMASTAISNEIPLNIIIIYLSAIFWTLGYDTIYGTQDISDDEIIGVKSTSIKFKKNLRFFVTICYLVSFSLILWVFKNKLDLNMITFLICLYFFTLIYQIKIFKLNDSSSCLKAFKINNLTGLILFGMFNLI